MSLWFIRGEIPDSCEVDVHLPFLQLWPPHSDEHRTETPSLSLSVLLSGHHCFQLVVSRSAFDALLTVSSASAAAPLSLAGKRVPTFCFAWLNMLLVARWLHSCTAVRVTVMLMCTNRQGLTLFHRVSVFVRVHVLCVHASLGFSVGLSVIFVGLFVFAIRPDSAEGFSSCPSTGSRNEDKDWENDSTTSSTPSNAEYTGI